MTDTALRIKEWRKELGLSQADLCKSTGIPLQTLKGYELGHRQPGAEALAALARTGVNMTWLLIGEGQMRLTSSDSSKDHLDRERLRVAIEAVEEGLASIKRQFSVEKKVELILAAYDLINSKEAGGRENVVRMLKLAA